MSNDNGIQPALVGWCIDNTKDAGPSFDRQIGIRGPLLDYYQQLPTFAISGQLDALCTGLRELGNAAEDGTHAVTEFAELENESLAEEERDRQQFISDVRAALGKQ